jgi:hypothetical protein
MCPNNFNSKKDKQINTKLFLQKKNYLSKRFLVKSISLLGVLSSGLLLSGCGDGDGGGSSPAAVEQSNMPSIVQEGKQAQSAISLSSTVPQLSSIGAEDVRQVNISDNSNCNVKLGFSPSSIKVSVDEEIASFVIFAPIGSGKCRHNITFNGDGVSDNKDIDVITDQAKVIVTADNQDATIGDTITLTLAEPVDWETVTASQSYKISTTALGVSLSGNPCTLNASDGQNSCQVTASIDDSASKGNYSFTIELLGDTGLPTDPEHLDFTLHVVGIYVTNFGSNKILYCSSVNDGSLTNCITAGDQFAKPEEIALTGNGGAYISNYASNEVQYCSVLGDGSFENCKVAANGFNGPGGMALDKENGIYIANFNSDEISHCIISENDPGTLEQCMTVLEPESEDVSSYDQPSEIVLDDQGNAYIGYLNANEIRYCQTQDNGSFSSCTVVGDEETYGFDNIEDFALDDKGGIYVANGNSTEVSYCSINMDGSLDGCIRAGSFVDFGFHGPVSVALDGNNGAYIANVETHEISYCDILTNGGFLSCKTVGNQENQGLNQPYGVTLSF